MKIFENQPLDMKKNQTFASSSEAIRDRASANGHKMYSWPSSTHLQNFVMVTLAVAMATLKNLSFFGKNGHFQLR